MVVSLGFEPRARALSRRRSARLSYETIRNLKFVPDRIRTGVTSSRMRQPKPLADKNMVSPAGLGPANARLKG